VSELTRDLGLGLDNIAGLSSALVVVFAMVREAALPRGLESGLPGFADLLMSSGSGLSGTLLVDR
jgi:hypothetical protein